MIDGIVLQGLKVLSDDQLNAIYEVLFEEMEKRGIIRFPDQNGCLLFEYNGFDIQVKCEPTETIPTTFRWFVLSDGEIVCDSEKCFDSLGDAEESAYAWIDELKDKK